MKLKSRSVTMYKIEYQLLDIAYRNHRFIQTEKSAKYAYRHSFHRLNDYIAGGINMQEWKEASKLMLIYKDKTMLFLYLNLKLKEIEKAISDEQLPQINYSTKGYLKSEYQNTNKTKTKYDFNNKAFQIAYHIGNLIRANIETKDIAVIANSDCHGDVVQFILPFVISKTIVNFHITNDYKLTYYTKLNNIIHINNGDYYIDTNHIRNQPLISKHIYNRCCTTANKTIQTLMLSILSDSVCYRLRAFFVMGNHDKLSFLRESVLWISDETKVNNAYTSTIMDRYLYYLCDLLKKDYEMKYDLRRISLSDNHIINTDSLINNICVYLYLNISGQLYLFQHGILKPFEQMKDVERLISNPKLISYEPVNTFTDIYCLKLNENLVDYRRIYETEIDIDTIGSNIDLLDTQKRFIDQILQFKTIFKSDLDMNLPIIIVGHNRNYDFLKLHKYKRIMKGNVFNEGIVQDIKNDINDVLLAKIILNDATSHELKTELIFDDLFSIDSYYDSTMVKALKDLNTTLQNNKTLSVEEKKTLINKTFSYPYYIPKLSLKGGTIRNLFIYIVVVFIIIVVIAIICQLVNEQALSMASGD